MTRSESRPAEAVGEAPPMPLVVTIDGPAGAGKSTVARGLAERLGWRFLDTGAMYRTVTLAALRRDVNLEDRSALEDLASRLSVRMDPGRILMDGEDVTRDIRADEVTRASRFIADCPGVRSRLVAWQRAFAEAGNTVTEGRDQGTIVFPDAIRKFFVTASDESRAGRRLAELLRRGENTTFEQVLRDQRLRDAGDVSRAIAPMVPAADAELIDTTEMTVEQVVEELAIRVHAAMAAAT